MASKQVRLLLVQGQGSFTRALATTLAALQPELLVIETADSLENAFPALERSAPDVVIVDSSLEAGPGLGPVLCLRERAPAIPVVVASEVDDETAAVEALQQGAQEVVAPGSHLGASGILRLLRHAIERQKVSSLLSTEFDQLGSHLQLMYEGFERLGSGDLTVRLESDPRARRVHAEFGKLLQAFDRTAVELQRLYGLRSVFYGMLAHDLKTPLNAITLASTALLGDELAAEKRAQLAEIIRRRSAQLIGMLDSLLDETAADTGQFRLRRSPQDVGELMRRCASGLTDKADEKRQSLEVVPLDIEITLTCDAQKVARVLDNLVENAIKYCHEGDSIRVSACDGDREVTFAVEDSGPGIAESELTQVFEPFYRADSDGTDFGTGLGLAICRQIVNSHGGTIWAANREGGGTRICFTLPHVWSEPPG